MTATPDIIWQTHEIGFEIQKAIKAACGPDSLTPAEAESPDTDDRAKLVEAMAVASEVLLNAAADANVRRRQRAAQQPP